MPSASHPTQLILGLRTNQLSVFTSPARFRVLVAGRRFGKTQLALSEMLCAAQRIPNARIWYVAPTFDLAKSIAWDRLKTLTRPFWLKKPSETLLTIYLCNGSRLTLRGADRPDTLRGRGLDFVVIDEFADIRPSVWTKALRPALADRKGRALFIGTPKGRTNHFYALFEYAKNHRNWAAFQFTTAQGGIVDAEELHEAATDADPETFKQEFEAQFTGAGHTRVYYAFDPLNNVKPLTFDCLYPLIWSLDFNVNPMCMLIAQRKGDDVHILEEIILPNTNTEEACRAFMERLAPQHKLIPAHQRPLNIDIYGDASGHQHRTSASETDWVIIRQFLSNYKGQITYTIRANKVNPGVRDRVNCVNSRLLNSVGDVRLFIDPKCKELCHDLEAVVWQTDKNGQIGVNINKSDPNRTHSSDALGYYIAQAFPLKPLVGHQSSGRLPG